MGQGWPLDEGGYILGQGSLLYFMDSRLKLVCWLKLTETVVCNHSLFVNDCVLFLFMFAQHPNIVGIRVVYKGTVSYVVWCNFAYPCICHSVRSCVFQAVKLTSSRTQLPYEYYSLPFCKPESVFYKGENLGKWNACGLCSGKFL